MKDSKPIVLFVSDLYYQANQRIYYQEDLFLSAALRDTFRICICHPQDTEPFEKNCDLILFRNTGPVVYYPQAYSAFRKRAQKQGLKVYNQLNGQADMQGKQYLLDLSKQGYPVIPSIDTYEAIDLLGDNENYILKPKNGADSIGLRKVKRAKLKNLVFNNLIVQTFIDFVYEVSFYFIDQDFQYALYAPNPNKRWDLVNYQATQEDLNFAHQFIEWNTINYGIQRVDACRTKSGELLLVELEDLNPFLSLSVLDKTQQESFISNLKGSLLRVVH